MDPGLPGASVRLLAPAPARCAGRDPGSGPCNELPDYADGGRAAIRTLTPVDPDPEAGLLTLDVVRHDAGLLTAWVDAAGEGDEVAVSGTGRGYAVDPRAEAHLLAGDETARDRRSARSWRPGPRPGPSGCSPRCGAPTPSSRSPIGPGWRCSGSWPTPTPHRATAWCGPSPPPTSGPGPTCGRSGEAAAVQRIRRHLFDERDLPRSQAHVRGYWKVGRGEA